MLVFVKTLSGHVHITPPHQLAFCLCRYANRAKNIKNTPHINEDPKDAKLREYLDELAA